VLPGGLHRQLCHRVLAQLEVPVGLLGLLAAAPRRPEVAAVAVDAEALVGVGLVEIFVGAVLVCVCGEGRGEGGFGCQVCTAAKTRAAAVPPAFVCTALAGRAKLPAADALARRQPAVRLNCL
jgi:hypothetical protein